MAISDYQMSFDTFYNVVNNDLITTPEKRRAVDPFTEEPLWEVPVSTQEDVNRAVAAAKAAYPAWRDLSIAERAKYIEKFAEALQANFQGFVDLIGSEAGKPPQGAQLEVGAAVNQVRETAKLRIGDEMLLDEPERKAVARYVPIGVGVGILPFNFPMFLGVGKLGPALLAGNTFIWKPSPFTPYSALKCAELGAGIFPPGVFQALSGDDSLGPKLTNHPDVGKVSFTGSIETGKKVMVACAATMKRVTLELGGKDATIVCEDADLEKIVPPIAIYSFIHAGQVCAAIKRIYVHEKIYDDFLASLTAFVQHLKVGDRQDSEAAFGPVQNKVQCQKLQDLYSQITKENWKIAVGGAPEKKKDEKGYYLPATVIDNPPDNSRIVIEESFGPILPVLKWSDEDEVVRRANAADQALGASVWSKDTDRAAKLAKRLEAGMIWVNSHFEMSPLVPWGGHKLSGIGMDWGEIGLKGWCNPQAFWIKHV